MAEEWQGRRDIALLREPRAVNTAENAVRSLEIVRAIEGASEVVLVCSIRHFPRVRFFFGGLYRRYGYRTRYRYVVRPLPSLPLVRHELSSIARMARDRRRGPAPARRGRRGLRPARASGLLLDWGYAACLADDDNTVAMGLLFYPRGGSALVTAYLSRALDAHRWHVTLACGSLGADGALGNATTFFDGIDTVPAAYDDAVERWQRGERSDGRAVPDAPLVRGARRRPRPRLPARVARAGRAHGRRLVGADRRLGRAPARARPPPAPPHADPRGGRRGHAEGADRDASARHRAQDARCDRARGAGHRPGSARAVVGRAHGRVGARAPTRRS